MYAELNKFTEQDFGLYLVNKRIKCVPKFTLWRQYKIMLIICFDVNMIVG